MSSKNHVFRVYTIYESFRRTTERAADGEGAHAKTTGIIDECEQQRGTRTGKRQAGTFPCHARAACRIF